MPLFAVIVSGEDRDVGVLRDVLRELQVESVTCGSTPEARKVLSSKAVDAVLLDGDLEGIRELIDALTRSKGTESPRVIAILAAGTMRARRLTWAPILYFTSPSHATAAW